MKVKAIRCGNCGDTIFCRTRHDFRSCTCKNISIDGGFQYKKVSFKADATYSDVELEITQSGPELFNDWNDGEENFGLIKENGNG